MIEETLKSIGLAKNEIKIYLALLELGPSFIGAICGKTKIHRRNVYDSIEMLKEKGFVSVTKLNNKNVFEAVNPKKILDLIDEKKINIESIMPKLLAKQNQKKSLVNVFVGTNGRKIIFEDKLKYVEEQFIIGAHEPQNKISTYVENYHKRRIAKKIHLKMLIGKQDEDFAKKISKFKYIETKILPKKFNSPIAINLYGNKIAIFLGSDTMEPTSILIEDKNLSNNFKKYFEMLWELSK